MRSVANHQGTRSKPGVRDRHLQPLALNLPPGRFELRRRASNFTEPHPAAPGRTRPHPVRTRGIIRAMTRLAVAMCFVAAAQLHAHEAGNPVDVTTVLLRAGERVERFFARAQSIVCLEVVRLQSLTAGWSSEGTSRTVESELRLSWDAPEDGRPSTEAQTLRRLLKVNGREPRKNDWNNCTAPEQQSRETQPLSLLLSSQRSRLFVCAGRTNSARWPRRHHGRLRLAQTGVGRVGNRPRT